MNTEKHILVGKIVAPQGIRGEMRVQTYTASPDDFKTLPVFGDGVVAGALKFVRRLNPTSEVAIVRIDGICDRNAAETMRGVELFVNRADLPPVDEDEYYQTDLIGFSVMRDGAKIGVVSGFQNFGAGDIIELDNGEMVAFHGADVNMECKLIEVK